MIICEQCESEYEDDAEYCNTCHVKLDKDNSNNLFDQQALKREQRRRVLLERRLKNLLFLGLALNLITTFVDSVYYKNFSNILAYVGLFAITCVAIFLFERKYDYRWKFAVLAAILSLPVFPWMSIWGVVVLVFVLARSNP